MSEYDREYMLRLIDACERSEAIDPPELMHSFPLDRVHDMVNHIAAQAARITRLEDAMRHADLALSRREPATARNILHTAFEGE